MSLSKISAKHPVSVLMIYTAVAVTGIISFLKLEINMFPDISIPAAYIITECASLSAEDIEKMITEPVENTLSSVSGIKEISSVSREALSTVKLTFSWDENMKTVSGEIREKIDTVYPVLPFESEKPLLLFSDLSERTLVTLALVPSEGRSVSDISRIAETDLKSRLISIEGVSEVRISGLVRDEIKIDVDYPSLINTRLTLDAVISAVSSSVFSRPAGKIYKGNREYRIRAGTDVENISDIGEIPLSGREGLKIYDIAEVYTGEKERTSYFHSDGKDCIGVEIIKTGNSGLINTVQRVRDELEGIKGVFRNDFSVTVIDDSSVELENTLKSLIFAILAGTVSAATVLTLFFRNFKTLLTVIVSLPVSLAMVFIYMYFSGISLNLISMTGLIIGTGMVFDNTIVVLDKLIAERPKDGESAGITASKTFLPVTGSTLTTVLIFLPLVFIPGISGKLFKDLAFTVIAFVSASAIVSETVPPAFYMLLGMEDFDAASILVLKLKSVYKKYLSLKRIRTGFLLFIFLSPLSLLIVIDKEIVPPGYGKKVSLFAEYLPGYSSEYYSDKSLLIEKMLLENGIAGKVHVRGGVNRNSPGDIKSGNADINTACFTITGKSSYRGNSREYEAYIEHAVSELMDLYSLKRVEARSDDSFLDSITGSSKSLKCILLLSDRKKADSLLSELGNELTENKCLKSVSGNYEKDNPEYTLLFNKEGFAASSLTPFDTGKILYSSVKGVKAASLDTGRTGDTDILVRYKNKYTDSAEKISSLRINAKEGIFDPSSFTEIEFNKNFRTLTRMNRKSCFYLNIVPFPGMHDKALSLLLKYRDRGLEILSVKEMEENKSQIILLFLSALVLIYFFLGAQFESFLIPLFLMFSIPLSVSGSFVMLFLTSQSLNISSFLGILILTGTTVNTAIMIFAGRKNREFSPAGNSEKLIIFQNQKTLSLCDRQSRCLPSAGARDESLPQVYGSSLKTSAEKRLVPASAAIFTTVAALVPSALQINSPLQSSSAAVLIGGLLSGGVSVLIIYPFLFEEKNEPVKIKNSPDVILSEPGTNIKMPTEKPGGRVETVSDLYDEDSEH